MFSNINYLSFDVGGEERIFEQHCNTKIKFPIQAMIKPNSQIFSVIALNLFVLKQIALEKAPT